MISPQSRLLPHCLKRPSSASLQLGFSLVEVIVTLSIVTIITTLVMFRYGSFNSAVLLKNQAYEIALDIREAQVFAISVRGNTSQFREEYGVYFSLAANENKQYVFWQDIGADSNPQYDDSSEEINTTNLDNRFSVVGICLDDAPSPCSPNTVSISFARPNFDAVIVRGGTRYQTAEIIIAPDNDPSFTRSIFITSTGQITVE